MANGFSERDWAAVSKLAEQWGRQAAERQPESGAEKLDEDFSQMEDASVQLAQAFQRGFLAAKTERHAEQYGSSQPCPDCGTECGRHEETRPLHVRHGCVELKEPVFYCPRCRRDFFPSAVGLEAHQH